MGNMSKHRENIAEVACDSKLSRQEFIAAVLKKAVLAGTIVAAPRVLDKFLIPPVYASGSTGIIAFADTIVAYNEATAEIIPFAQPAKPKPGDSGGWG
jgi:hypothetical protein